MPGDDRDQDVAADQLRAQRADLPRGGGHVGMDLQRRLERVDGLLLLAQRDEQSYRLALPSFVSDLDAQGEQRIELDVDRILPLAGFDDLQAAMNLQMTAERRRRTPALRSRCRSRSRHPAPGLPRFRLR